MFGENPFGGNEDSGMNLGDLLRMLQNGQGKMFGPFSGGPDMLKQLMGAAKEHELNDRIVNYLEREDPEYLLKQLKDTNSEVQLETAHHLTPGDILVRLTPEELEECGLPNYPYKFPYIGQPIEVVKIVQDPIPNSSGEIEDFVAKVPLFEPDCDTCKAEDIANEKHDNCPMKIRSARPYALNSRFFKPYEV
jgi:hypothetical protein